MLRGSGRFGRRHWKPALRRVGNAPLRGLYDLRHTYATFALRAGVPVFAVSRFMGSSVAMIDYHYNSPAIVGSMPSRFSTRSRSLWTLGGRQDANASPPRRTKGAD